MHVDAAYGFEDTQRHLHKLVYRLQTGYHMLVQSLLGCLFGVLLQTEGRRCIGTAQEKEVRAKYCARKQGRQGNTRQQNMMQPFKPGKEEIQEQQKQNSMIMHHMRVWRACISLSQDKNRTCACKVQDKEEER